ncbi:hypothetical protein ACFL5L_02680 [candidate division KSB1 bacterium]
MKGLKIVLWVVGIAGVLCFLSVIVPWTWISRIVSSYNWDISGFQGFQKYWFRIGPAGYGFIGIFFIMLARNPLKYGAMLLLGGYGLLVFGLFCLFWGIYYTFPILNWLGDLLFSWITGGLILYLRTKAGDQPPAAA